MKLLLRSFLGILLLGILYLCFWPVHIDPVAWDPGETPSLTEGPYKANDYLASVDRHLISEYGMGPEDVAIDTSGNVFVGLSNGKIIRFTANTWESSEFADTEGRPLGVQFDSLENLIVADAVKGLLSISPDANIELLTDSYEGKKMGFVDDLDIGSDGTIYFSDASAKYGIHEFKDDLMEHRPWGSVYSYNPATRETKLLMDGLHFSNGIALGRDEQYVMINETASYRIWKYWLKGPKAGSSEIFVEGLPGFPDNLSYNGDGIFWVACANPRKADLDGILPSPFLRKVVMRLPESFQPAVERYSMVLAFDESGKLLHNLQDTQGTLAPITSVHQVGDKLYMGSLEDDAWGIVDMP
ncbi:MAG: SMP-30/gluconolactonase/LRE family protein [Bacteroidota bacterium]